MMTMHMVLFLSYSAAHGSHDAHTVHIVICGIMSLPYVNVCKVSALCQDVYRVTPHMDNDSPCSVEKPACCGVCQY